MLEPYVVRPNEKLIAKAKEMLSLPIPTNFEEKHAVCFKLNDLLNEMFEYREKTFIAAIDHILHIPDIVGERAVTIVLDSETDKTIHDIFKYQQKIFKPDL